MGAHSGSTKRENVLPRIEAKPENHKDTYATQLKINYGQKSAEWDRNAHTDKTLQCSGKRREKQRPRALDCDS